MALETPEVNIEYTRGDSRAIIFVLTNKTDGTPLDLTGYASPQLAVNDEAAPTDISGQQFTVAGVFDGDRSTGRISFSPTTTDSDLTPNVYFYDAQVNDAAGGLLTFVKGQFKIVQDITKA